MSVELRGKAELPARSLEDQHLETRVLYEVTLLASTANSFEEVLHGCLKAICTLTGWPIGHAYVPNAEGTEIRSSGLWHLDKPDAAGEFRRITETLAFTPGKGLPGRVLLSREPLWIQDLAHDAQFSRAHYCKPLGVESGYAFPILVGGQVHAVLEFFSRTPVAPDESLLMLMRTAGEQVGRVFERTRASLELAQKEKQLSDFIENATIGLHWVGPDGIILWANRAEMDMLGYAPEEYIGRHIAEFHADQAAIEDILTRLGNNETLREYCTSLRCKDGSLRHVTINSNVYRENGKFIHTRCFTRDITAQYDAEQERQRLLEALEREQTLLRQVVHQMPMGVVVAAADSGEILMLSDYIRQTAPQSAQAHSKILWEVAADFTRPDGTPYTREEWPLSRALLQQEKVTAEIMHRKRDDGETAIIQASAFPVFDTKDTLIAAVTTFENITDRRRAEERLHFLVEASAIMASSLDYQLTLKQVARLLVPQMADWCAIEVLNETGESQRIAVAHVDPDKVALGLEVAERYPASPDAHQGIPQILRTGQTEFVPEISEDLLRQAAQDEEHFRIMQTLGLRAYIGVPLIARGRTLGALLLVAAESGRGFSEEDVHFAEDLARRAAIAVDNARLLVTAQRQLAERTEAETALRKSEEQLRFTLEAAHVGTWNWDIRSNALQWSENLLEIHGIDPGEFGGTFDDFQKDVHPDDREQVRKALNSAMRDNDVYQVEYRLNKPAGDHAWVEGKGRVIRDALRQPVAMAGICMDVTERKLGEQRFRAAVESSPSAVVMVNTEGIIALVNTQTERLFGYDRTELLGQRIEMLVPAPLRGAHAGYRSAFHANPQARPMGAGRELFGLRKDGTEVPIEIGLNPIQMSDGIYVLSAILDITERKKAEQALREANEELIHKNAELEQFVYTVSHDLKSPLVTATGFVGLLKEDLAEGRMDEVQDSLTRLERATLRMSDLIDDLLDLSRIGRLQHDREPVPLGSMVHEVQEDLAEQLTAREACIVVEEPLPTVLADPVRVSELLQNLLSNAVKYGCDRSGCTITVGSVPWEDGCRVYVRDQGPGVPPEYHEKIFGLFQRLDTRQEGTGVGLAIVARVMQLLAGRVWVESKPGEGATFWLEFPQASIYTPEEQA